MYNVHLCLFVMCIRLNAFLFFYSKYQQQNIYAKKLTKNNSKTSKLLFFIVFFSLFLFLGSNIAKFNNRIEFLKFVKFIQQTTQNYTIYLGNLVLIVGRVDENWLVGEINGRKGLIPTSFIQIIEEETGQHFYNF